MNRILSKLFALMFLIGFSMKLYGAPIAIKANPVESKTHATEQVQHHDDCDDCDDCDCGDSEK